MQNDTNIIKGSAAIGAEFGFSADTFCRLLQGPWASFVADGTIWKSGKTSPWRMFRRDLDRVRRALCSQMQAAE